MLYLSEPDVLTLLTMPVTIELLEGAFRMLGDGSAINHPRRRIVMPNGATLAYMAAATPKYFGTKVYSVHPKGGMHFQVLIFRTEDAMPLATIEANHMGQIRTGAASGVATKYMARKDADTMAVIGSGFQAETQIAAISEVRALREVRVWSRRPERRAEFARKCAARFGLHVVATETAREAVEGAGIVVTATSSKEPVLESAWISPGTHINAMGSNWLIKRELPVDLVLEKADLVTVDSVEDAHLESGDLVIPGFPFRGDEFCEHMVGTKPGRTSREQITIFKSNGLAVQDVAAAGYVYEQTHS